MQGYDGASVMSGVYGGVQAIMQGKCESPAPFVHCCTHNLCLVTRDAVACDPNMIDFFETVAQVNAYF